MLLGGCQCEWAGKRVEQGVTGKKKRMHAQSTPPVQTHLRKNHEDDDDLTRYHTLDFLCTCFTRDTTDFSVHKQEKRKNSKSPRKKCKKITKKRNRFQNV